MSAFSEPTILPSPPSSSSSTLHDSSFSYSGKRLATCSGDRSISVYDLASSPIGGWEQTATWQAHEGSVWKVCERRGAKR